MKFANHNLSHDIKMTGNMGELIPVACFEALPGDVIDHECAALIRTQPLVTPVMHSAEVKLHTWFVPYRILHDKFDDFITGGRDGLDNTVVPTITLPSVAVGSLADYLGVPTSLTPQTVSAYPFRAYARIFSEFYRDQDLMAPLAETVLSGNDTTTPVVLQNACWEKDYFTSARTSPQKGNAVTVPLTGNAPVRTSASQQVTGVQSAMTTRVNTTGAAPGAAWSLGVQSGDGALIGGSGSVGTPQGGLYPSNLFADLASVAGININDLRLVVALQRFKENMSRFGSRYNERLEAFFGVKNLDQRLQLPEYLGGGTQNLQFSEVLQTAQGSDPVGSLRGHGIGAMRSNRYKKRIPEYGIIITLMVARPKTQYMDGIHKMWNRPTKEDFYQPELEHLGQQAVLNKEVYAAHSQPNATFGFVDRYDEYRRIESRVSGDFRTLLDSWHMARKFTADVALNQSFVQANPTTRIYAITSADHLLCYVNHRIFARRRLAKFAKPMLF